MSNARIVSLALLLMAAPAAAETAIQPLPPEACQTLAGALSKATGIKLDVAEGDAPDYPEGLRGKACRMAGKATGLTLRFDQAQDKITAALGDWTHDFQHDADGPASTVKLYARGSERLVYALETEPPKGACKDDRPIGDCKAPRKTWLWDFSVSAYRQ
jgi:hypothetical protein